MYKIIAGGNIMGYTNYWNFNKVNNTTYASAKKRIIKLVQFAISKGYSLGNGDGENGSIPEMVNGLICFNGIESESHEPFYLANKLSKNDSSFNFCKTANKEYDAVVVAAILILKDTMKDAIDISSDGISTDAAYDYYITVDMVKGMQLYLDFMNNKDVNIDQLIDMFAQEADNYGIFNVDEFKKVVATPATIKVLTV